MTGSTPCDVRVPLPPIWGAHVIDEEKRISTEAEIAEILEGKVDDPEAMAAAQWDDYMQRAGGGTAPLFIASFREDFEDESTLAATMTVIHNQAGDLETWAEAFEDAEPCTVSDRDAVLTYEATTVGIPGLADEPITVCTWRWIVDFDETSTVVFSFSSPNHELQKQLYDHYESIMADVTITATEPPADAD